MFIDILMIILGFIFLGLGANFLVKGSGNIATKFHIPEMLVGLTIVSLGTSAPELMITITSANSGAADLIIGNAIGSNLCNLLLILGLMAIIRPIIVDKDAKKLHLPISLACTLLILFIGYISPTIYRGLGVVFLILFFIYFSFPIFTEIKDIIQTFHEKKNDTKKINVLASIFFIILGVVLLKYGGDFVVDYSSNIAEMFNLSERVIGLTIVAIGTAMPELITSIFALLNDEADLAVGNLVGSCILNFLLILGIGAVITPLTFSSEFIQNLILLSISCFIIWIFNFIGTKDTITRFKGFILLLIFAGYMTKLFL